MSCSVRARSGAGNPRFKEESSSKNRWKPPGVTITSIRATASPKVLERMRSTARRKPGIACVQNGSLTVDFLGDLAIQNVEPFVLPRVAMPRRSGHWRHGQMEDRSRAIGVGIRQFYQNLLAEDVQWFRRAPLSRSQRKCVHTGPVGCHHFLLRLLVVACLF